MSDATHESLESFAATLGYVGTPIAEPTRGIGLTGHDTDLRECAAAIRKGSKSFYLASKILPAETRAAAVALYAFCRHSDDLIDDPRADRSALEQLRGRLSLAYQGTPASYPCDRAFAQVVRDYGIPKCAPDALLDGFAMDLSGRRYKTIAEVKEYATCVAATVGLMMSLVMRTGSAQALARAADMGIAMQLTNIARDVGEDARNGRLYLPEDWLLEAGVDPDEFLASPRFSAELGRVIQRLLDEASDHYRLGHAGVAALPKNCRHAIRTAALVYQEIGSEIALNDFDSVTYRAHTDKIRKMKLLIKARLQKDHASDMGSEEFNRPADPSAAMLVAESARAYANRKPPQTSDLDVEPDATDVERFLSLMIKLQLKSRAYRQP